MLLVPLAIGFAILRYHLFDIDLIIRKTLIYTLLTVALAIVFFGSVTLLQTVFSAVSGQRATLTTVLSTLVIAAIFNLLRQRSQDLIDRHFYHRRYDAQKTLQAFATSLREAGSVELEHLMANLRHVIEETLQPTHLSLWLRARTDRS
jgi:hypothetical protein